MELPWRFEKHIKEQYLFNKKDKLLLAVSGGVDSVVLCELCKLVSYEFAIAHCNFQLRGEESDRDETFVKKLAEKYGVAFFVKKFDTEKFAADKKISIQEAARELRYSWFSELVDSRQSTVDSQQPTPNSELRTPNFPLATRLLTAHHADDNAETVLMNFCRGTGLHGLTGIPASANYIRRPLLIFSKEELLRFAEENKLDFVEDSSNSSSKYTRNLFRNEIIPSIGKVYPNISGNLRDNIERFKGIEKLYKLSVGQIIKKLCKQKGNEIHIPVKQLMGYANKALIYEIIAGSGFQEKQVDEVIKLAASDSGKYIVSPSGTHRIIRHRHWFIISPTVTTEADNIIIEEGTKEIIFPGGKLVVETTPSSIQHPATSNMIACLDAKDITFPLLLRKWKTADYFYPLGMKKKKKLSRFFIDQKLSKTEKEKIWVIESNQRIIWVVGHRIDERFRLTEKTGAVLKLTLK